MFACRTYFLVWVPESYPISYYLISINLPPVDTCTHRVPIFYNYSDSIFYLLRFCFLIFARFVFYLQRFLFICSDFVFLFAAILFFICSDSFLFAAILFLFAAFLLFAACPLWAIVIYSLITNSWRRHIVQFFRPRSQIGWLFPRYKLKWSAVSPTSYKALYSALPDALSAACL